MTHTDGDAGDTKSSKRKYRPCVPLFQQTNSMILKCILFYFFFCALCDGHPTSAALPTYPSMPNKLLQKDLVSTPLDPLQNLYLDQTVKRLAYPGIIPQSRYVTCILRFYCFGFGSYSFIFWSHLFIYGPNFLYSTNSLDFPSCIFINWDYKFDRYQINPLEVSLTCT